MEHCQVIINYCVERVWRVTGALHVKDLFCRFRKRIVTLYIYEVKKL
jgi:hypothetical protein